MRVAQWLSSIASAAACKRSRPLDPCADDPACATQCDEACFKWGRKEEGLLRIDGLSTSSDDTWEPYPLVFSDSAGRSAA
jgi:hypothetical protein